MDMNIEEVKIANLKVEIEQLKKGIPVTIATEAKAVETGVAKPQRLQPRP